MAVARTIALAAVLAAPAATPAAEGVELYRRVVPLEATTGVVTVRQTLSREIEVPERCEDGSWECRTTRRFGRIWSIGFEVETGTLSGDELRIEREGRGTAHLALAATRADEESYDELLREALARLGAAAFDEPFAGLRHNRSPFYPPVAQRSQETSWSCFENGSARTATRYDRTVLGGDGGGDGGTTSATTLDNEAQTRWLCTQLEAATATAASESVRTMSTPRALREIVLSADVSDDLPERVHADELAPLPEGAELARKLAPGVGRSAGMWTNDTVVRSRLTVDEVETSSSILPAALPVEVTRSAWHARFTLETVERRLGPLPDRHEIERWSLTASLLPTLPPRDEDAESGAAGVEPDASYAVRLDEEALFKSVAGSLDFRAEFSPAVLADAIVTKIAGLGSPAFILVICLPEEKATWGLPPTMGRARLLNGSEFCRAVERRLP